MVNSDLDRGKSDKIAKPWEDLAGLVILQNYLGIVPRLWLTKFFKDPTNNTSYPSSIYPASWLKIRKIIHRISKVSMTADKITTILFINNKQT